MSLCTSLTLHTVVDLFLESAIVSHQHFNAVFLTLALKAQLVNELLLSPCDGLFLTDVLRELLVLGLDAFKVVCLVFSPFQLA